MLRRIIDFENYGNLRIKAVDVQRNVVRFGIEDEAINSISDGLRHQEKGFHSSVRIRPGMTKFSPCLISVLHFKTDCHATCRCATRGVQDVC